MLYLKCYCSTLTGTNYLLQEALPAFLLQRLQVSPRITRRVNGSITAAPHTSGLQLGFCAVFVISATLRCLASPRVRVGVRVGAEDGLGLGTPPAVDIDC
jgi:hypothetical protein